jgi:hypothetical protein
MTPAAAVTPTKAMMPAIAVTPEEAGTPAAAHEFCGDSQKKSLKLLKVISLYSV